MSSPSLLLRWIPYSRANLWAEIRKASTFPGDETEREPPTQVRYLASYLDHEAVKARTLLVEAPYVDRHYIEEFTGYYATTLHSPPSTVARIHVFRRELSDEQAKHLIERAASGSYNSACAELQKDYVGFIAVRPVPGAPIGRTILSPYDDEPERRYGPRLGPHQVHLAGLELTVHGVPFQQQDQAVGACATTALWSALARVTKADGGRACTPYAVTAAANKHVLSGRPFPATAGLELAQMLGAIREFGYSPHVLKPERQPEIFVMSLKCYVESGIPTVLQVKPSDGEPHAITLIGFRPDTGGPPHEVRVTPSRVLRAHRMSRLYVHDDRLGPYARVKWTTLEEGKDPELIFWPYESGFEAFEVPTQVWKAIVPLYPKIRLTAEDLITLAGHFLPLMQALAGSKKEDVLVDLRFALGGLYLKELFGCGLSPERVHRIATRAVLSRYVGVIRFAIGANWLADVICDTTEILRAVPRWGPVLAMIARSDEHVPELDAFARYEGMQAQVG